MAAVLEHGDFPPLLAPSPIGRHPLRGPMALALPPALDGHAGTNRASGKCHDTDDDLDALRAWLDRFSSQPATVASYRREVERLLFWALLDRRKPLSALNAEDMAAYPSFLANPVPNSLWVTERGRRVARDSHGWRPFARPLSPNSARQSLAVVSRLFAWLSDTGYLSRNPMLDPGEAAGSPSVLAVELMREDFLRIIKVVTRAHPAATDRERERIERSRWLFSLMHYGGLRIPEIARHAMGAFRVRPLGDSGEWWMVLDESRGVRRRKPASPELMKALIRYRMSIGLTPLPDTHESTPLVLPIGGRHAHLKPRVLHDIVKTLFDAAARFADEVAMAGSGIDDGTRLNCGGGRRLRQLAEAFCLAEADESAIAAASCDEVDAMALEITGAEQRIDRPAHGGRVPAATAVPRCGDVRPRCRSDRYRFGTRDRFGCKPFNGEG